MTLSIAERKHRMPFGAQKEIAANCEVSETYVSLAMNDEIRTKTDAALGKLRRVQAAIAQKLGMPIDEVFPAEHSTAAVA